MSGSQEKNSDVIEAEIIDLNTDLSTAMLPVQRGAITHNRAIPRSNVGDGGYFDATGKRRPVFTILPADDAAASFVAIRAWLSALRHHPVRTMATTGAVIWFGSAGLSGGLNFMRGDIKACSGDGWNPVVAGCNLAAMLAPPTQSLAGEVHDAMLGETQPISPVETRPVIRAVRVDGER